MSGRSLERPEGRRHKAEGRRCSLPTAYCLLGLLCFCPVVSSEEFPLPADVQSLHEPYDLNVGTQPVKAQGFTTALSIEQLRAFYTHALPKHGWKFEQLPWAGQVQEQLKGLEKITEEHPELKDDPSFKEKVAHLNPERLNTLMGRQLYAARGKERLLLNLTPQDHKTLVFINRWQDSSTSGGLPGFSQAQPGAQAPAGWPAVNPCCEGEASVPTALRTLPSSIPQYPNGRLLSTGSSPNGVPTQGMRAEMYLTKDSVEAVAEYYRSHMAYNGFSPVEMPGAAIQAFEQTLGEQGASLKTQVLAFKHERGMCGVVITEKPDQTLLGSEQQPAGAPAERTVIMVNYMESASLNRALQ